MQPLKPHPPSLSHSSDSLYKNVQLPPIPSHPHQSVSTPQSQPLQQPTFQQQQQQQPTSYTNIMNTTTMKQTKIRKPRACDLCRRKKIRCDYDPMLPNNQCSSCRGYQKTCDFAETAKKRGPPKGYVEGLETRLHRMEQLLLNMASSSNVSPEAIRQYINSNTDHIPSSKNEENELAPSSPLPTEPPRAAIKRLHEIDESRQSHDERMMEQLENAKEGKYSFLGSSSGVYMLNRLFPVNSKSGDDNDDDGDDEGPTPQAVMQGDEDDVMVARFGYKSSRLNVGPGSEDTTGISSPSLNRPTPPKWNLPPKPVIDRLVELYFTEMNSFLPIVDEEEFMDKYRKGSTSSSGNDENEDEQGDGVSKILLMTICRVTIRMLPVDDPVVLTFNLDRESVFQDLVKQIETNYELDFMEPQIEGIQILLLSSANAGGWSPNSANWLATSIAVKMAQDLGLHRSNTQWTLPAKRIEARKRLWWSAYIVDRWVCASLGRPLTVNDADCDLEYPKVDDKGKYTTFVAIIKLSGILGDVLRGICSPRARTLGDQGLGPDRISNQLKQALKDWKQGLPSSLWLDEDEIDCIHRQDISVELESKINSGAGQLRILYIAVQLLSKRPAIFLSPNQTSLQSLPTVSAPQECLDAVHNVLDIFYTIKYSSLLCVGWSLTSYGLSQTLLFIFLNHKNENEKVAAEARRQIQTFKERYQLEYQFVETKLITFLDSVTRIIDQDVLDTPERQNKNKNNHTISHSGSLWGASSGMDWHDIMDLITE